MTLKKAIHVLERRAEHLAKRIAQNPDKDLSYDRAEIAAINVVLNALESPSKP